MTLPAVLLNTPLHCNKPLHLPTCPPMQVQGNNKLKVGLQAKNRLLLREAIEFYNKGLSVKCSDTTINVALFNNKAHVNSLLGERERGSVCERGCAAGVVASPAAAGLVCSSDLPHAVLCSAAAVAAAAESQHCKQW
jgi:hypothetical protein